MPKGPGIFGVILGVISSFLYFYVQDSPFSLKSPGLIPGTLLRNTGGFFIPAGIVGIKILEAVSNFFRGPAFNP